jgi:hypothetical protein
MSCIRAIVTRIVRLAWESAFAKRIPLPEREIPMPASTSVGESVTDDATVSAKTSFARHVRQPECRSATGPPTASLVIHSRSLCAHGEQPCPASILPGLQQDIARKLGGGHTQVRVRILQLPSTLNRKDQSNGKEPAPALRVEIHTDRLLGANLAPRKARAGPRCGFFD